MGFNCLKATEPLQGGSLLFTIKFPESHGIYPSDQTQKAESTLEPPSGFKHRTPGLGIQHINH